MNFDALFVNPTGRTSREQFVPAMVVVLAVFAFYAFYVTGRNAHFCMLVLLYPIFVLLARRLHDMGKSAGLLLVPLALSLMAFASKLHYFSLGDAVNVAMPWAALVVSAAFALWGSMSEGK